MMFDTMGRVAGMHGMTGAVRAGLNRRSVDLVAGLETGFGRIILGWTALLTLGCMARILFPAVPVTGLGSAVQTAFPYLLVAAGPVLAYIVADRAFPRAALFAQPQIRLSFPGRWRNVDILSARGHHAFGPTGLMASLLVGMILNVPVRSIEFLMAIPAMNGNAPIWGQMLMTAMTADVVVLNFFYTICFVMALRNVPWFPRMLLLTWGLDLASQFMVGHYLAGAPDLPAKVGEAMAALLDGNMKKVAISAAIWLPYLILSERVNVTYRSRISA